MVTKLEFSSKNLYKMELLQEHDAEAGDGIEPDKEAGSVDVIDVGEVYDDEPIMGHDDAVGDPIGSDNEAEGVDDDVGDWLNDYSSPDMDYGQVDFANMLETQVKF